MRPGSAASAARVLRAAAGDGTGDTAGAGAGAGVGTTAARST